MREVRRRRGEVAVTPVKFTKADFLRVPERQRTLYFALAQAANEIAVLRALIIQALNGAKGSRPIMEAGLGMAFMLSRLLAGRVFETWKLLKPDSVREAFGDLAPLVDQLFVEEVGGEVGEARDRLIAYFSDSNSPLIRVRNKLAFHMDLPAMQGAFDLAPDDADLTDWHTGRRGTTFYGGADTLTAIAASHVINDPDPVNGQRRVVEEASRIGGDVEVVVDGYLVAFIIGIFGRERLDAEPVVLKDRPLARSNRLHFFMDTRGLRGGDA